jgi:hypothetical protein
LLDPPPTLLNGVHIWAYRRMRHEDNPVSSSRQRNFEMANPSPTQHSKPKTPLILPHAHEEQIEDFGVRRGIDYFGSS